MTQNRTLYNGSNPTYGYIEHNFNDNIFASVGENVFETYSVKDEQVFVPGHVLALDTNYELVIWDEALPANNGGTPFAVTLEPLDTRAATGRTGSSIAVITRSMGAFNFNAISYKGFAGQDDKVRVMMSNAGLPVQGSIYSAI